MGEYRKPGMDRVLGAIADPTRRAILARLAESDARRVLQHLADLWSYDVSLVESDASGTVMKEYVANPRNIAAAA